MNEHHATRSDWAWLFKAHLVIDAAIAVIFLIAVAVL